MDITIKTHDKLYPIIKALLDVSNKKLKVAFTVNLDGTGGGKIETKLGDEASRQIFGK
jgi:hypothetical protein